jgi:hypothetical protein
MGKTKAAGGTPNPMCASRNGRLVCRLHDGRRFDDADSLDRSSLEAARLMLARAAAVREDVPNLQVLFARASELTNGRSGSTKTAPNPATSAGAAPATNVTSVA